MVRMCGHRRGDLRFPKLAIGEYQASGLHIQQPAEDFPQRAASGDEAHAVSFKMKPFCALPLVMRERLNQFRKPLCRNIERGRKHVNIAVGRLQAAGRGVPQDIRRLHTLTICDSSEASSCSFAGSNCGAVALLPETICPKSSLMIRSAQAK